MKNKKLFTIFMTMTFCTYFNVVGCAPSNSDNNSHSENFNSTNSENSLSSSNKNDEQEIKKNIWNKVANFSTGFTSSEGGVAEIVKYNEENGKFYLINGKTQTLDIVNLQTLKNDIAQLETVFDEEKDRISFDLLTKNYIKDFPSGFALGDITSVAINEELNVIAVALQDEIYSNKGAVALLNYDGSFIKAYSCGVQPDMVTFAGNYILTADEGEPRLGYNGESIDPKGSVTIIDLSSGIKNGISSIVTFDKFDNQRSELVNSGVVLKKDALPSSDLEPEFIATNGNYAYVSLQEANSIATLDLKNKTFLSILPLGFKNHNIDGNEIDLFSDGKAEIKKQNVYGVYMPDGIDTFEVNGETYLITANEGDAREWGDYSGVKKTKIEGTKVETLDNEKWDGIEANKTYILGGRSFSIFNATNMSLVYDSGSMIESTISKSEFKEYFNCSNDDVELDSRSKKKGPEPETVKVVNIDNKLYAFVGLERISGVMMFDISNFIKDEVKYISYANSRDYSQDLAGDVAPEGLDFLSSKNSPIGKDLLFVANENSGTVSIYALEEMSKEYKMHEVFKPASKEENKGSSTLVIYSAYGSGDNVDGPISHNFIAIKNISKNDIDLSNYKISYSYNGNDWLEKKLVGTINADDIYIIRCATANMSSAVINIKDSQSDLEWNDLTINNKVFSLKLTMNNNIIDALGADAKGNSSVFSEGTPINDISKQKIVIRKDVDTNNNIMDFEVVSFKGESQNSEKVIAYMKKLGLE